MEEITELKETSILSHRFNDGQMFYLTNSGEEAVWVAESGFSSDNIENYWNNVELFKNQNIRPISPGELIGILPNRIQNDFCTVIQRQNSVDPLMIANGNTSRSEYTEKYFQILEDMYFKKEEA